MFSVTAFLVLLLLLGLTNGFILSPSTPSISTRMNLFGPQQAAIGRRSTRLSLFGPKQALAIERRKDEKKFEQTINGLMKVHRKHTSQHSHMLIF